MFVLSVMLAATYDSAMGVPIAQLGAGQAGLLDSVSDGLAGIVNDQVSSVLNTVHEQVENILNGEVDLSVENISVEVESNIKEHVWTEIKETTDKSETKNIF